MNKPRPRRIAADEAHAWARNLRLGNPYAKLVLSMLTIYVNGEGICFVGIEALAGDTELSADTVRKRLAWLEKVGVIKRRPQWIDADGRRNGESRGRRTSDEIELLIDADPELVEWRTHHEDDEIDPSQQQGLGAGAPRLALGRPSDSGKGLTSEPGTNNEEVDESCARESLPWELTKELALIAGIVDDQAWPPGWATAAYRVAAFLREGYTADDLRNGTRVAMAYKRDGPPRTIEYFAKPWAKARGQREAAVPQPERPHVANEDQPRTDGNRNSADSSDTHFGWLSVPQGARP